LTPSLGAPSLKPTTSRRQADDKALQAPFRSGIEVDDYQLDPVVRALQMPRVNLLIARRRWPRKTIEAGLVAQELILRHRVKQIPAELARETAHLRSRYANPQPRLFPLAVTFLVPYRAVAQLEKGGKR
jgi:hypothetical protein